ncbi:chemotaxis protein MotC [Breoghania corrubedonensis]|uniref:Chemotaxis protein MotC n=1 Tax=Breoghania corrubedonensis TaxID=665038 RepID=A0A2T5V8S4_9HYPH|nr:chemotaxis protein [Breoghania corrubedonensis]PTW60159.1 chemotaxis protein MotC [Breoghania corrubedonensis]
MRRLHVPRATPARTPLVALIAFWLLAAFGYCAASASEEAAPAPFEMVRSLQALQGQVAHGNSQAHTAQRVLLKSMRAAFEAADPEVWQDPRNARAAVVYLLSGGHPAVMVKLLGYDPKPAVDERLMRGALAYIEGRADEARTLFEDFDPLSLEPGLGGQVALVRAALLVHDDPAEAIRMLDVARLLMPGTLVEEAALRREVFLVGKLGDLEKFQSLSLNYLRRYRGSVYGGDFRRRFAAALDSLGFADSATRFALLESLLAEFDIDSRRTLYIALAHHALVKGQLEIVRKATDIATPLAMAGTDEALRLKLYRAGALIGKDDVKEALSLLWSIDRKRLDPEETELLDAIFARINQVRYWPDPPKGTNGSLSPVTVTATPDAPSWETPLMKRAGSDIDDAKADLEKATRRP